MPFAVTQVSAVLCRPRHKPYPCQGIDVPDLPPPLRFSALRRPDLTRPLAEVEAEYIRNVLAGVGGNKTKAAEILQIDRKTLRKKMEKADGQDRV